jgi:hypothetical protein
MKLTGLLLGIMVALVTTGCRSQGGYRGGSYEGDAGLGYGANTPPSDVFNRSYPSYGYTPGRLPTDR